ncbi:MAG: ATP-dependent helicase, partial [Microbacterium sp.]
MAQGSQRRQGARRTAPRNGNQGRNAPRNNGRARGRDDSGVIPQLARAVREVEAAVERRSIDPAVRTKFQVVALLAREERTRIKADTELTEGKRGEELKRLDGIATILAQTAARDSRLFELLDENAMITDAAKALIRELKTKGGVEVPEEDEVEEAAEDGEAAPVVEKRVIPQAVRARQLANPFLVPDFAAAAARKSRHSELARWELLGPLFRSFEEADGGGIACMPLPAPIPVRVPEGLELMQHQAGTIAAAAAGHRSFLLADEPGLGKTAQALLAAQAANAYPMLVVVPNVVKTNWAREAER